MPDRFTHAIARWTTYKTTKRDIGLVVIDPLIPDPVKINLSFIWTSIDHQHFFDPIHAPISSILVAGIISLFLTESKKASIFLSIGFTTHFILDFFLVHVSGGMRLLFPFS